MSHCLLCKSPEPSQLLLTDRLYWHCKHCDLIQLDPNNYLDAGNERDRYLEHNNSSDNEGYIMFLTRFLEQAVEPYAPESGLALDYGCGPGPVLQGLLQDRGFEAHVFDPFFFPARPTEKYDLVTCTEVIEHVFDPALIWRDLASLVTENGVLSMMTRFHPGPQDFGQWWYRRDTTHVSFYSPRTLGWIEANYPLEMLMINDRDIVVYRKRSS